MTINAAEPPRRRARCLLNLATVGRVMAASIVLIVLGFMCLVVGGVAVLLGLGSARAGRLLRRTAPTPLASWRPGGRRAAVGRTALGPSGVVRAPWTGVECAWYLAELVRRSPGGESAGSYERLLWRDRTPGLPGITDGTGEVWIGEDVLRGGTPPQNDPVLMVTTRREYDGRHLGNIPPFVPTEVVDGIRLRLGDRIELREIRVDHDVPVFVYGRVAAGPHGPTLVTTFTQSVLTTDSRERVLERRAKDIRDASWLARWMLGVGGALAAAGVAALAVLLDLPN